MIEKRPVKRYLEGDLRQAEDLLAVESPVELSLNGETVLLSCSPGKREELAWGYLLSQGFIGGQDDLSSLEIEEGSIRAAVRGFHREPAPLGKGISLKAEELLRAGEALARLSEVFRLTGGTHVAALFPPDGAPIPAEDVSRHCALWKAIGGAILSGADRERSFLLLSSRLSRGMLEAVARARIPVVGCISAPTAQAVARAEELGVTVCGFLREGRFNVYSRPDRIEP